MSKFKEGDFVVHAYKTDGWLLLVVDPAELPEDIKHIVTNGTDKVGVRLFSPRRGYGDYGWSFITNYRLATPEEIAAGIAKRMTK